MIRMPATIRGVREVTKAEMPVTKSNETVNKAERCYGPYGF